MAIYRSNYTGEQIDTILAKAEGIEVNKAEPTTATATKLTVDNVTYELKAGTDVVPNPPQTASAELHKLAINNVIYEIAEPPKTLPAFRHDIIITIAYEDSASTYTFTCNYILVNHDPYEISTVRDLFRNGITHFVKPAQGLSNGRVPVGDGMPVLIILDEESNSNTVYVYKFPFRNQFETIENTFGLGVIERLEDRVKQVE